MELSHKLGLELQYYYKWLAVIINEVAPYKVVENVCYTEVPIVIVIGMPYIN